jgi:hypothetical protein
LGGRHPPKPRVKRLREFSPESMQAHWASGLQDIECSLVNESWRLLVSDGHVCMTYDLHREM